MRILHRETNQIFDEMEIFLTVEEADKLIGYLQWLVENHEQGDAFHLDTDLKGTEYQKELTIAVYTETNQQHFDERTKKLIKYDE